MQNLVKNTDWDNFYELENPIDLWNFILKTIEQRINIMSPIKFIDLEQIAPLGSLKKLFRRLMTEIHNIDKQKYQWTLST